MEFLRQLAGMVTGPGAMAEDPVEAFKLYAPPGLFSEFTPEEQAAYGRQIQEQQRYINADLRPKFSDVQKNLLDALQAKQGLEAVRAIGTELSSALGSDGNAPAPVSKADQYRRAGDLFAVRGMGDKAKQYYEIADKLDPEWNTPQDEEEGGKPVRVQYNRRGERRVVQGASPIETFPAPTFLSQGGQSQAVQVGSRGTVRPVTGFAPPPPDAPGDVREALIVLGIPTNTDLSKLTPAQRTAIGDYLNQARVYKQPKVAVDLSDPTAVTRAVLEVRRAFDVANKEAGDPEIASRFQSIQAALAEANAGNPQADGAIIYNFAKILDPAAAVQEGDKKTILGVRNIPEQIRGIFNKYANGQTLTANERANLYRVAVAMIQRRAEAADARAIEYQGYARALGAKDNNFVSPYSGIKFESFMRNSGDRPAPEQSPFINPPGTNRRPIEWYFDKR